MEKSSGNLIEFRKSFCEIHKEEEVERVCFLSNCKKNPLLCWQCLLDDKEHSDSHRQHFMKIPDFFKKFLDEYEIVHKKSQESDIPENLKELIDENNTIIEDYDEICENTKEEIKKEFEILQGEIKKICDSSYGNLCEAIEKKRSSFKETINLIQKEIEDYYGVSPMLDIDKISEEINKQKENLNFSKYLLSLKQKLLPKVPPLKDVGFTSLLNKFSKLKEEIPKIEQFSRIRKSQNEIIKYFEKSIEDLRGNFMKHFALESAPQKEDQTATTFKKALQLTSANFSVAPMMSEEIKLTSHFPTSPNFMASQVKLALKKTFRTSHSKSINAVKILNDSLVATASKDKTIKVWKISNKELYCTLDGHKDNVCCLGTLNLPNDLPLVLSGGGNFESNIIVWDLKTKKPRSMLPGHQSSITTIISLEDNKTVISGSYDNNIIIWDIDKAKAKVVLRKHSAMISCLKVLKEGKILASGSWDKTVSLWNIIYDEQGDIIRCEFIHSILENFAILSLASSFIYPNRLIYAGTHKKFFAYNIETKEKEKTFECSHFGVNEMVIVESNFLDNQDNFAIIGLSNNDSCIRVWEGSKSEPILIIKERDNCWIENLNTSPKIEVFSNFEDKTQVCVINNSESDFALNFYELKTN